MSRKNDEALFDELASGLEYEAAQPTPTAEPINDPGVEEREIQQMVELINKIKLLRKDIVELVGDTDLYLVNLNDKANFVSGAFRELDEKISSLAYALKQFTDIKREMQEVLDKNQFTYKVSEDSMKRLTKQVTDSINRAYDAASKDAYRCASEYLRKGVEATLKDGENRIREFSEEIHQMKKKTEIEGSANIPYKWIYWYLVVTVLLVCWGVVGFMLWYRLKYGEDGMTFLAWATVAAIASVPVYSIIRLIYDWKDSYR